MKRVFLLIVVPALLVALGFAQTPAASSNTNQMNIKGCLGGSDGNYTVAEDNTGQIFNITSSSADLKPHVGQDVKLIGQKAGAAQNSVAVTELNMISEHCTAAAAAPAAAVSTPSQNLSTPPASAAPAAAPDATVSTAPAPAAAPAAAPDATASTAPASAAPAAAPDATASTAPASAAPAAAPDATASTAPASAAPAAAPDATASTAPASAAPAATPDATVSTASENVSAPAATAAVHPTPRTARLRKPSETPTVAAAPPEPVSTPAAAAPVGPPSETTNAPAAPVAPATNASTSRSAGMLVSIVVVVLLIGAGVPLYNRWRKRKLLEQTRGQNLSFTKEAKSDPGKSDTGGGRKAA
jgi:hypothetical protein